MIRPKHRAHGAALAAAAALLTMTGGTALAGPNYDLDRKQLEAVLEDLKAWLPAAWDSFPQIYHERTVSMPEDGEHEHWHRTFALIDAPQISGTVFYGQINLGGRDGPIMGRSQVLYQAVIDESRGVVAITGQPMADAERFANLHDHPELWKEVRMRDEAAVHCDFIWRRHGTELFGVLEGKTPDWQKYGPGTCNYITGSGAEFFADAEWVLSPEELWLYDINTIAGVQFIGRKDRTHLRLYRSHPYRCELAPAGASATRVLDGHDRGLEAAFEGAGGRRLAMLLLRNQYPVADAPGLRDELRLMISDPDTGKPVAVAVASPRAARIELATGDAKIECRLEPAFPPMIGTG